MAAGVGLLGFGCCELCFGSGDSWVKVQVHSPGWVRLYSFLVKHFCYQLLDVLSLRFTLLVFLLFLFGGVCARFIGGIFYEFLGGNSSCSSHPGCYGVGAQLEAHLVIHVGVF